MCTQRRESDDMRNGDSTDMMLQAPAPGYRRFPGEELRAARRRAQERLGRIVLPLGCKIGAAAPGSIRIAMLVGRDAEPP